MSYSAFLLIKPSYLPASGWNIWDPLEKLSEFFYAIWRARSIITSCLWIHANDTADGLD